ncbi:hypothetical protein MXAN_1738 [Myxococcus xanthus DK 1622]|uniref:Uncharacterized protein n=1 Tax=Myxococcus xanthus (strain DK1622) TaxID=246197 RepID=Q1DBI5_MYXXD|nr:hypothetical protein MXAN_1738 [Myxococcus xanthus DK 1622]
MASVNNEASTATCMRAVESHSEEAPAPPMNGRGQLHWVAGFTRRPRQDYIH